MDVDLVDDDSIDGLLHTNAAFAQLDTDALELVRNALEARVVRSGEVLMRQGDIADGLYIVGSGRLQVMIERDDGSQDVINEVGRGHARRRDGAPHRQPRSATITACCATATFCSFERRLRPRRASSSAHAARDRRVADLDAHGDDPARLEADAGDEHRGRAARRERTGS